MSSALAQTTHTARATIYFLGDESQRRRCGYGDASQWRDQARALGGSPVAGEVDYVDGRVSAVHVSETDESGDWAVSDECNAGGNGTLQRLKRTINIIPEDNSEEQVFLLASGTATADATLDWQLPSLVSL